MNIKNEHVFPKESGWTVRREGSRKISRMFDKRKDAMEYAGIIALYDNGSVVAHKYNGQFKNFKHGNEIYVKKHKTAPIITGTVEMKYPITFETQQTVETMV